MCMLTINLSSTDGRNDKFPGWTERCSQQNNKLFILRFEKENKVGMDVSSAVEKLELPKQGRQLGAPEG